ncbi:MAG: formyl transferase [Gammaproteobacteria bacterium]|nr:MAG: formyl transferase [Gammaproteobacteria bacterium]
MSKLSILILCGNSPRHLYIANRLCDAGNPIAIVQETGTQWSLRKIIKLLKPANFYRKACRWLRDRKRYTGNREESFFFGSQPAKLDHPELIVSVPHINHPDVLKLANKSQPDVIAVFGTSLIKGPLLKMGKQGIINLHGGLSPHYRGADCTFWALYNREPDQVGCTLHFINEGIDTGNLIAHICPEVKETDDELVLFWRAVKESANTYVEAIKRIENGEKLGQAQNKKGTLYQVKDRGLKHEQKLSDLMQNGLLRNINLPTRIHWFQDKNR